MITPHPREGKTLLLLGGSGLVGHEVLTLALADQRVRRVVAPSRHALAAHPKLQNPVIDFETPHEQAAWWTADSVVCALGTTMAKAGSEAAFRHVDYELPLAIARLCRERGATAFALNSALGANAKSRIFYSRVKGELEDALRALAYPSLALVRPGLLGGNRQESRLAERLGMRASLALAPLLPRRWRIVPPQGVAHHLLDHALVAKPGVHVVPSEHLID